MSNYTSVLGEIVIGNLLNLIKRYDILNTTIIQEDLKEKLFKEIDDHIKKSIEILIKLKNGEKHFSPYEGTFLKSFSNVHYLEKIQRDIKDHKNRFGL
jgi:hypothetical protein